MTSAPTPPRPMWRRIVGSFWFQLLAAFVVTGLVLSFVAKPFWVPSGSMQQTLEPGDRILVNRLAYLGAQPSGGDVVVFDAGDAWDEAPPAPSGALRAFVGWLGEVTGFGPSGPHTLVKRIIGAPGQTVECCDADGAVVVDGIPLDEPYVSADVPFDPGTLDCTTTPRSLRCFGEVTVPDASYLVLGDNRSGSSDSAFRCRGRSEEAGEHDECWRWAAASGIVGRAVVVLWPISRWSGL